MASTVKIRRTSCLHLIINCTNDKKCACTYVCFFPYLGTYMQKHILHQNWRKKSFPFGVCILGKGNVLSQAVLHFSSLLFVLQNKPKKVTAQQRAVRTSSQNHHIFPLSPPFHALSSTIPSSPPAPTGLPAGLLTSQVPMCHPLGCSPCVEPFSGKQRLSPPCPPPCPPINPAFGSGQAVAVKNCNISCNSSEGAVPAIQATCPRKVGIAVGITKSLCGQKSNDLSIQLQPCC